ncbi:MAG: hypothetical protein LBF80_01155 [Spirochaetaceae bacterium]|jgi:hypothetical protein|nr:hypothetical protein [Spirochaetaceae bacterium]
MKQLTGSTMVVILTLLLLKHIFEIDYTGFIGVFALLLVFVTGTIYAFVINGWHESIKSFKTVFDKTADGKELKAAIYFFKILEKSYLFFGCFGMIISIMNVFRNIKDASEMGVMFAMTFVNISFAFFLIVLCVLPFKVMLTKRMNYHGETA